MVKLQLESIILLHIRFQLSKAIFTLQTKNTMIYQIKNQLIGRNVLAILHVVFLS